MPLGPAPLVELRGAILGNPDTALAVLNQFPTLEDIADASNAEPEDIAGIGKSSAKQQKSRVIWPGPKSPFWDITPLPVARLERKRRV